MCLYKTKCLQVLNIPRYDFSGLIELVKWKNFKHGLFFNLVGRTGDIGGKWVSCGLLVEDWSCCLGNKPPLLLMGRL